MKDANGWFDRKADTPPEMGRFIAWDARHGRTLYTMHWSEEHEEFLTENEPWSGNFTHWRPALKPPVRTD